MYLNLYYNIISVVKNFVKPGHEMYLNDQKMLERGREARVKPGHEMYLN